MRKNTGMSSLLSSVAVKLLLYMNEWVLVIVSLLPKTLFLDHVLFFSAKSLLSQSRLNRFDEIYQGLY